MHAACDQHTASGFLTILKGTTVEDGLNKGAQSTSSQVGSPELIKVVLVIGFLYNSIMVRLV